MILSSSVSWLCILRLVWKRSSNSSNFSVFPSNKGILVVSDFGILEILLMLLWKFAELLLFANCWRANNIWSTSIVAGVFLLRNCGWMTGRTVFLLLPWRCTRGAVCDFLVNSSHIVAITNLFCSSYHHVMAFFWARILCHLAVEEARFRTKIILGVVFVRSLACV